MVGEGSGEGTTGGGPEKVVQGEENCGRGTWGGGPETRRPREGLSMEEGGSGQGCPGEEMVRGAGSGARGGGGPAEVVQRRRWPREGGLGKQGQERWPRGRHSPGMVAQRRKRSRVGVAQGGRKAGGGGEMAQQRLCRGGGPGWEGRERSPRGWLPGRRPSRGGGGPGSWEGEAQGRPRLGRATATLPGDRQQRAALPVLCRAGRSPLPALGAGSGARGQQGPNTPVAWPSAPAGG